MTLVDVNGNAAPPVTEAARVPDLCALSPDIFKAYDIRGLYGEQIGGRVAYDVGRAFARVLGTLAGKEPGQLRIGLGRDMRLSARELAARYREGMVAEGADVLDAGMVGTEMLYWLVGSRDLDGGLMCTASHNPKAYTGATLVERSPASAASATSARCSRAGWAMPRAAGAPRTSRSTRTSCATSCGSSSRPRSAP